MRAVGIIFGLVLALILVQVVLVLIVTTAVFSALSLKFIIGVSVIVITKIFFQSFCKKQPESEYIV